MCDMLDEVILKQVCLKYFPFLYFFFLELHVTVHVGIEVYLFHCRVLMVAHAWDPLLTE